ncbi:PREDICTED: atrial natriuretic peptide receptor 2-like [Priapulus caudatus]|uniref:Atrial natriuretic peptide receptor 2-like n=1 Tax=Priapulus caudatus TaxID=37621 RepID=A0ABM1DP04_PRICU|nr:PREDICTED: atrial natriuretic peptide receptor 2-like [Priapulus caudatus]XP_014661676.1 PREDICTED: atrial natriuretic peptide receptor 2-like [Priapulus caudatus]
MTVFFSEIEGFTKLTSKLHPMGIIYVLNEIYGDFDKCLATYDVYKVETIRDSYMVASGVPERNHKQHAAEIANVCMDLMRIASKKHIRSDIMVIMDSSEITTLPLRIGIHSGLCMAGVVGLKMPRYCLFGDTINTSSRMMTSGHASKIHISEATKNLLDETFPNQFTLAERGLIPIKGKGEMLTFWLQSGPGQPKPKPEQLQTPEQQ